MTGNNHINSRRTDGGVALYLTMVAVGVMLFIAVAISALAFRQIQTAGIGLDSQQAFYAANSAAECALFLDRSNSPFAPPGEGEESVGDIDCGSSISTVSDVSVETSQSYSSSRSATTFTVEFDGIACPAEVTVTKQEKFPNTIIEARGRSAGGCQLDGVDDGAEGAYERGVRVRY